jgi:hypothetical protein
MTKSKRNHLPIMVEKQLVISNELKCVGFCGPEISPDTLKYFVSHFSLVEIIFCCCHFISDDFLKETAAQCGRFHNTAEEFTFLRCDSVTIQGIKTLMIDQSPLKIISITSCKNITLNDMYDLKALALEKNGVCAFFLRIAILNVGCEKYTSEMHRNIEISENLIL